MLLSIMARIAQRPVLLLAGATPAPLPARLSPHLAVLGETPTDPAGWVFEIKYDGYRMLARVDDRDVRLYTRNGHNWTSKLPLLLARLARASVPTVMRTVLIVGSIS